jgi:hypothetical protein
VLATNLQVLLLGVALTLVACASVGRTRGVFDVSSVPAGSGYVLVRGDRIDVLFPRAALEQLECRSVGLATKQSVHADTRAFAWSIGWRLVDTLAGRESSATVAFSSALPRQRTPMYDRPDSAFSRVSLWITAGDAPYVPRAPDIRATAATRAYMDGVGRLARIGGLERSGRFSVEEPGRRAIYFDQGRLHVAMTGHDAQMLLLHGSRDTLTLRWCPATPRRTRWWPRLCAAERPPIAGNKNGDP